MARFSRAISAYMRLTFIFDGRDAAIVNYEDYH